MVVEKRKLVSFPILHIRTNSKCHMVKLNHTNSRINHGWKLYGPGIGQIFLTITQDTKVVRENTDNLTSSRIGCRTVDWFQIRKGVRQGCILSPCFFNLYAEYTMQNAGLGEA